MENVTRHIIDNSGYDEGDPFHTDDEARQYFTVQNFIDMFGECEYTQDQLDVAAAHIVENKLRW